MGSDLVTDQIAETEDKTDKTEAGSKYEQNFRRGSFRGNVRNYGIQNSRGEYRDSYRIRVMIEAGTGLEKGHFSAIMEIIELEVKVTVDTGQDPELAQIGI